MITCHILNKMYNNLKNLNLYCCSFYANAYQQSKSAKLCSQQHRPCCETVQGKWRKKIALKKI